MNNDSPLKAILVVLITALLCSIMVSVAAVWLKPFQLAYAALDRNRWIVKLSGLAAPEREFTDREIIGFFQDLDARPVDLDGGVFEPAINPYTFDQRKAATDPERSAPIPGEADVAKLGRRSHHAVVYLAWSDGELNRIILPIHGQGMWSTIYGFVALESDFNTIAAVTFYEQAETAGIGDRILRADWQARWAGRFVYDESGEVGFRIAERKVDLNSPSARYEVDALTGATVTATGVTNLVRFWLGPQGFGPLLDNLRRDPSLMDNT
jgi:Na+-transporting NADH:ubiquinone oxidoreductase subunit C